MTEEREQTTMIGAADWAEWLIFGGPARRIG